MRAPVDRPTPAPTCHARSHLAARAQRMNRYPLWKYIVIAVALVVGIVYTLPNFFPEVAGGAGVVAQGGGEGRRRAARRRSRTR